MTVIFGGKMGLDAGKMEGWILTSDCRRPGLFKTFLETEFCVMAGPTHVIHVTCLMLHVTFIFPGFLVCCDIDV